MAMKVDRIQSWIHHPHLKFSLWKHHDLDQQWVIRQHQHEPLKLRQVKVSGDKCSILCCLELLRHMLQYNKSAPPGYKPAPAYQPPIRKLNLWFGFSHQPIMLKAIVTCPRN
jgi:hypothetical protein